MPTTSKAELRAQLRAARRGVADEVRAAEARLLEEHLERLAPRGGTVCAYCFTPFAPDMRLYSDAQIAGIAKVTPPFERPRASTSPSHSTSSFVLRLVRGAAPKETQSAEKTQDGRGRRV